MMRLTRPVGGFLTLVLCGFMILGSGQAHAFSLGDLMSQGKSFLKSKTAKVKGSLVVCAASEKKKWLQSAKMKAAMKKAQPGLKVTYRFAGSGDIARNLNDGNRWGCTLSGPASNLSALMYHDFNPKEATSVALAATVLVSRGDQYDALAKKFGLVMDEDDPEAKEMTLLTFMDVSGKHWKRAVSRKRKSWGQILLRTTNELDSNSGLTIVASVAHGILDTYSPLTLEQVQDEGFQAQFRAAYKGVERREFTSTGGLTRAFKASPGIQATTIATYENFLPELATRITDMRVTYPDFVTLNNHPMFFTGDTSNAKLKKAADAYMAFLLSVPAQTIAVNDFGFRPANADVRIPKTMKKYLSSDLSLVQVPKKWDVMQVLLNAINTPQVAAQ